MVTATSRPGATTVASTNSAPVPTTGPTPSSEPPISAVQSFGTSAKPLPPGGLYDGKRPPQFVLISFDGAAEPAILDRWLKVSREAPARMSFFLSMVYMLDPAKRELYQGPRHKAGESAIGFAPGSPAPEFIRSVVTGLQRAQREGHELGLHYAGHWCGPSGVKSWNAADWNAEIDASMALANDIDGNNGLSPAVGSPYLRPPIGARTPCLDGNFSVLFPVLAGRGFRYDASRTRSLKDWPIAQDGLWSFAFPSVTVAGSNKQLLAVDYSMDVNLGKRPKAQLTKDVAAGLTSAVELAMAGNRAPFEVSNHFTELGGGAYNDAVEQFARTVCPRAEVHCVNYRELVAWLDAHAGLLPGFQEGSFRV